MTDSADPTPLASPTLTPQTRALPAVNADEIAATAGVYRLLARLWLREVDLPLLQELATPPLRDTFLAAGGVLPDTIDATAVEELAIDYCRLFIGPTGHLPPYQSVWQSGQLQSQTVTSMRTFFEITGYRPPPGSDLSFPDHLGLQLDLAAHIGDQFRSADESQLAALDDLRRTYAATHLTWPANLFRAALQQTEVGFYQVVIAMTREFLHSESRHAQAPTDSASPRSSK